MTTFCHQCNWDIAGVPNEKNESRILSHGAFLVTLMTKCLENIILVTHRRHHNIKKPPKVTRTFLVCTTWSVEPSVPTVWTK